MDVMLGQCKIIERPLDRLDEIVGLYVVEHSIVVYNSHYWRRFNLKVKKKIEKFKIFKSWKLRKINIIIFKIKRKI